MIVDVSPDLSKWIKGGRKGRKWGVCFVSS